MPQVDGSVMLCLTFGDERCECRGLLKAANHAVDQLVGVFWIPFLLIVLNQLLELISQALLQIRLQFQLIGALLAFQGALASSSELQLI